MRRACLQAHPISVLKISQRLVGAGESMDIKRTRPHGPSATWQLFLYGAMCAGCAPGSFRAKLQCVQSTAKTGYQFPRQYCATCMHQVCWRPVNSLRPQESIAVSSRESAARSYHNLQFKLNAALPHMAVISALCDVRRICAGQNSKHCNSSKSIPKNKSPQCNQSIQQYLR